MKITLPFNIESPFGEKIIFKEIINQPDGDKLITEGSCKPKGGPPMHVHFKQDESLTVKSGTMGYQILGEEPVYLKAGQTATFYRNQPHRFWNAGDDELNMNGWVKPPNSIIFFLSTLYAAQAKSGKRRPEVFDGAYLMVWYRNEYDLPEIPSFVKKVFMPMIYYIGMLLGKYRKFKDAPKPL